MAHPDHLGLAPQRNTDGDNIYNGAVDNASGAAALLAIARACASLPKPSARSILFAAVAAEEQGLLGSQYLAEHPSIAPGHMAAVINIDCVNIIGPTRDVNVIGLGKSNLDELVDGIARWQNRVATPDQFPDRGYYYRSDQFNLAKIGVPGVYLHSGPRSTTISPATSTATPGTCAAPSMTSACSITSASKSPTAPKCPAGTPATSSKPPANPPSMRSTNSGLAQLPISNLTSAPHGLSRTVANR